MHSSHAAVPAGSQQEIALSNPFTTAAIALQARPPAYFARMVSLAICVMAALALLFTCFARLDVVVSAQGRVIPSGKSKVVQPMEAGIVKAIAVRDGQKVKAGDVLLELDPTTTTADSQRLRRELWEAEADVLRTTHLLQGQGGFVALSDMPKEIALNQQAILASRELEQRAKLAGMDADVARRQADSDAIHSSLVQIRNSLPLVRKKHEMREELARTGHIAETGLIETRLELINLEKELSVQGNRLKESSASLNAARQQRAQAAAEFRARVSTELVDATKKREAARQELIKANQRRDLQVIKAPVDGVVQQLAVTTVGGIVTQAQALMTIVPENTLLEVEAQVMNRDIGRVLVGQRVITKVETFDFTRYGYIEGEVLWVGTDAVTDPKLGPVYPVRIRMEAAQTPNSAYGRRGIVTAGMSITADIKTDERRMIEYFLSPMLRYKDESLRER
jgi:hemolysin D